MAFIIPFSVNFESSIFNKNLQGPRKSLRLIIRLVKLHHSPAVLGLLRKIETQNFLLNGIAKLSNLLIKQEHPMQIYTSILNRGSYSGSV